MTPIGVLGRLLVYYALLVAGIATLMRLFPEMAGLMPLGRVEALLARPGEFAPLDQIAGPAAAGEGAAVVKSFGGSLVWLSAAVLGALAASLPVSQVYMAIRDPEEYDQSLVDTVVVLPLVVTTIVVIVQHSLALAFSLAGIAGAARYRNTMKASGDLMFILLAIGIGMAAGIGAVELALIGSAAFNLVFLALWATSYGERTSMKRYMGGQANHHAPAPAGTDEPAAKPGKAGKKAARAEAERQAAAAAVAAAVAAHAAAESAAAAAAPPGGPEPPAQP